MRVHLQKRGGARHQLTQSNGAHGAPGPRVVAALDFDVGAIQVDPLRDAQPGLPEGRVTRVAQRGRVDLGQDLRGGCVALVAGLLLAPLTLTWLWVSLLGLGMGVLIYLLLAVVCGTVTGAMPAAIT